jgi:hypothetical protein
LCCCCCGGGGGARWSRASGFKTWFQRFLHCTVSLVNPMSLSFCVIGNQSIFPPLRVFWHSCMIISSYKIH